MQILNFVVQIDLKLTGLLTGSENKFKPVLASGTYRPSGYWETFDSYELILSPFEFMASKQQLS